MQSTIAQHLKNFNREEDEEARKEKLQVIEEARQELTQEAENYERAKKVRIDHYYSHRDKTCRLYAKVCIMFPFR